MVLLANMTREGEKNAQIECNVHARWMNLGIRGETSGRKVGDKSR